MGNGLDIAPNGYGPRFRPGLNYPTIYDLDDDDVPDPPRSRGDRIFSASMRLFFGAMGLFVGTIAIFAVLRGNIVGAVLAGSAAGVMFWHAARWPS